MSPPASGYQPAGGVSLAEAVQAAHEEGQEFGGSVARDAPALWLEAVLARKPRMPSDLEARLLQGWRCRSTSCCTTRYGMRCGAGSGTRSSEPADKRIVKNEPVKRKTPGLSTAPVGRVLKVVALSPELFDAIEMNAARTGNHKRAAVRMGRLAAQATPAGMSRAEAHMRATKPAARLRPRSRGRGVPHRDGRRRADVRRPEGPAGPRVFRAWPHRGGRRAASRAEGIRRPVAGSYLRPSG